MVTNLNTKDAILDMKTKDLRNRRARAVIARFMLRRCAGVWISLTLAAAGAVCAQGYPNKPVRIVTSGVGAATDFVARTIAQGLTPLLGQQVIVDNRASGFTPAEIVARAVPDGYTLLCYGSTVWIIPLLQNAPYDPVKDFAPITITAKSPHVVVVHPTLAVTTIKELIALAKSKPGTLNDASLGTGTATHLGAELFKSMAGVNIVRIPYKSGATQMADLVGGQVQLAFAGAGTVTQHLKAGRLRALAVTSAERTDLLPGVPTVSETLPGYESGATYVMFAPARTPPALIRRLNAETVRVLNQADVKGKFFPIGVQVVGSTPEELTATMKTETVRLGKLIKDAGIRVD
jgi:tripartite-type tricarboxylate transporter receptor subunit TctC